MNADVMKARKEAELQQAAKVPEKPAAKRLGRPKKKK